MNAQLRKWLIEGRCPDCGELGSLDVSGGARCSNHGAYQMVLNPPQVDEPDTPFKFPGLLECLNRRIGHITHTIPFEPENFTEFVVCPPINCHYLSDAFAIVEKQSLKVGIIGMNPMFFSDFRIAARDVIDIETERTLLNQGYAAYCWTVPIIIDNAVPENTVYVVSEGLEPSYVVKITPIEI